MVLLQGPGEGQFLMSEVPLYRAIVSINPIPFHLYTRNPKLSTRGVGDQKRSPGS